jgi:hypothetical protein
MFSSDAWKQWVSLNANNLVWIALVSGGVLFTDLLMKLWQSPLPEKALAEDQTTPMVVRVQM